MTSPLPPLVDPYRQRGRKLLVVLVWCAAAVGLGGVVFLASTSGSLAGASMALIYALIPLPMLLFTYWWLDRVEPEPFRYLAAAFTWGAVVAVAIALPLEIGMAKLGMSDNWLMAFGAPVAEEFAKGLFLLLTMIRLRRVIDGVLDGLIVSGLVAVGFAATENVGYYAASYLGFDEEIPLSGAQMATATFVVRGLFSPFAHPLFTAAVGVAIGIAASTKSSRRRKAIIAAGFLASIGLHALWNGSLLVGEGLGFLLAYVVLGGLLVAAGILAIVLRVRQFEILTTSLTHVAGRGWLHPAEVPWLVRFNRRRQCRDYAKLHGPTAAEAVKRYQMLATEMAFVHDAVMTGRAKPNGVAQTYALLDQMWLLRPHLRFPPALPPGVR